MIFRQSRFSTPPARLIAALSLSAILVACGGGSGGDVLDEELDPDVPVIGVGDEFDPDEIIDFDEFDSVEGCQGGTDIDSFTPDWDDNCQVLVGGDHATSSYAQGIQRIVFSRGFTAGVATIGEFADGIFGPITADQVMQFQEAQGITVDGIVGPETWGELQAVLEILASEGLRDVYGVAEADIGLDGVTQFFQAVDETGGLGGWTIATFPGSPEEAPFSVGAPIP